MSNYSFRNYEKKDFELAVQNLINIPYYFEENDAEDFVNEQIESVDRLYCVEVNNNICLIGGYKLEIKKNKEVAYIELLYEFFEYKHLRDYYEVFFLNQIINYIRTDRILIKCTAENYHRYLNNGFKIIRHKKDYRWHESYKADLYLMELDRNSVKNFIDKVRS